MEATQANPQAVALTRSGESKIRSLEEFNQLAESEYHHANQVMIEEYKGRKAQLAKVRDIKIEEYRMIGSIVELNTQIINGNISPAAIMAVEKELAALDFDSVGSSMPLEFWKKQYGENMIVQVVCDIMMYFLNQFQVKETLTGVQMIQLAAKLVSTQPMLRMKELVFALHKAASGEYGPTYLRIGPDMVLSWLQAFYEQSSKHLECRIVNSKQDESRGESPWLEEEKQLKRYEEEQRQKKMINEKVWQFEKKAKQVADYKDEVLNKSQSPKIKRKK